MAHRRPPAPPARQARIAPLNPVGDVVGRLYGSGWDLVTIGGLKFPGHSRVNAEILVEFDPKKAKGKDGARPTFHGIEGKPLTIDVECWTDEQRTVMRNVLAKLLPHAGKTRTVKSLSQTGAENAAAGVSQATVVTKTVQDKPRLVPLPISYPSLDDLGIVNVIVLGATAWVQSGQRGMTRRTIRCLHWIAPAKGATKTPTSPVRNPPNARTSPAATNPSPVTQPGVCGPPAGD